MAKIQVLDEQTIDQIAAGEVVERPSSVVKELVENAIDAKSTAVTVEIKDGGISLIRITDNGSGIESKQIPVAFFRHATSKIRSVDDLLTISSLGFRGEALSSIAAVSMVELITKTQDEFTGTRYLIEGGKEMLMEEIGAPCGTTFLVKNLFYNTPARKKFLKAPQTEAGYISDMMERIALSHPEISFKFINNGQIRLHTSGNGSLKDIIYHIYGRDIAANLLEIKTQFDTFSVEGYIGKPVISRGNRNFESYFINGRYIKSKLIAKSIEDAYHGFMMQHKYPFTVLSISMNGNLVDVNVHPNKMEMRFSNAEEIYKNLIAVISGALKNSELIPKVAITEEKAHAKPPIEKRNSAPEPFEEKRLEALKAAVAIDSPYEKKYDKYPGDFIKKAVDRQQNSAITASDFIRERREFLQKSAEEKNVQVMAETPKQTAKNERQDAIKEDKTILEPSENKNVPIPEIGAQQSLADLDSADQKLLSSEARPKHKLIGQLFETYWLVEYENQFYMIDQHAAHEKILYEETMRRYHEKDFTSQMINPPILLSLTMQEELLLKRHLSYFEQLGFAIEHFGGKEYKVTALPANLYSLNGQQLLLELIDSLGSLSEHDAPELVMERVASMSCKAAVKGNQKLSIMEASSLIDQLLTLENPYFCPHGRPVIVSMTKTEIEKKFKRIV